jgi:hypothetical protein
VCVDQSVGVRGEFVEAIKLENWMTTYYYMIVLGERRCETRETSVTKRETKSPATW